MQDATDELNRPLGLLLGLGVVAAALAPVALARRSLAPTPAECLAGDPLAPVRPLLLLAAAGGAGALALLGTLAVARLARAGTFAQLAATALAVGLPLGAADWLPPLPGWGFVALALAAGAAALASVPLLRERGLLSLALGTAVAAIPVLWALRSARLAAHASAPLSALQRATAPTVCAATRVAVLLDQGLPADAIAALPLALQPPFVDTPRTLIAARADSLAGRWLRRLGLPTFHLAADRCELVPALPALAAPTLAVTAGLERDAAGAVTDVWIETEGRDRGHMAVLFTPCGELLLPVPGGRLHLASAELQLLRAWLAPLPTGLPIQVLVVAPASADAYGAAELQT